MLSREENELLCRVGPDAPMGAVMRRYWIPGMLGSEVTAGGDPKRIRLLGEDLVAFRDQDGKVGILDENCPHRGASLVLARAEGCGLRCLYHGWLIAADGRVLETPAEPDQLGFKDKVRAISYPVREAGGMVWVYMGPRGTEPPFSDFEWCTLPLERVHIAKVLVECNWAQVIEGVIDSAHSNYLHSDSIRAANNAASVYDPNAGSRVIQRPSNDGKPRIEVKNTDYGFRYAAIRKPTVDADVNKYVRVTLWVAPFYSMFPAVVGWGNMQAMIPVDDEHTIFTYIKYKYDEPISAEERAAQDKMAGFVIGEDIIDTNEYRKRTNRDNNWMQDRDRMRRGETFTGIKGVNQEDIAVEESMGAIYDRSKEHLGTSDVAVIRYRRLMIDSVRELAENGTPPVGLRGTVPYPRLRAEEGMLPLDEPWEPRLSVVGDEGGVHAS